MTTYERTTRIEAPFARVWKFHSDVAGLEALTPAWLNLEIESIHGSKTGIMAPGTVVDVSVRPFGVGPRRRFASAIKEREAFATAAYFRDELVSGPFPKWDHVHLFFADGDATIVRDRVDYQLPPERLGRFLSPMGRLGLAPFFAYRHWKTRQLLEADGSEKTLGPPANRE